MTVHVPEVPDAKVPDVEFPVKVPTEQPLAVNWVPTLVFMAITLVDPAVSDPAMMAVPVLQLTLNSEAPPLRWKSMQFPVKPEGALKPRMVPLVLHDEGAVPKLK